MGQLSRFREFLMIAIFTMAFGVASNVARAMEPNVILACTPTEQAMERCEASGGRFDTLRCRCVGARPTTEVCTLVCFDGELDARRCRCIRRDR